jgi:outer membrane receptor protein involved in Fe transport
MTSGYARAESESSNPAQVEEVVVTAQRRQQNLQDVPISVTAASTAALAAAHVDNFSNIKALSPGVSFTTNYNPAVSSNIQIRGIGTVGSSRAFEGAVGVFVDGVYRTRAGGVGAGNPVGFDRPARPRAGAQPQLRDQDRRPWSRVAGELEAYGLLNLNVGLKSKRNGWTAELWCLNCTDKTYYTFHYQKPLQAGSEGAYPGPPFTFGIRLIGHF